MDIDWSQPFRFYSEAMNILCAHVPVYLRDITSGAISGHRSFPILKSGDLILMLSPKKQVYLFFATPPTVFKSLNIPSLASFHLRPALFHNGLHHDYWEKLRHRQMQGTSHPPALLSPSPPASLSFSSSRTNSRMPDSTRVLHRLRPLTTPIRSPSSVRSGAAERHADLPSPLWASVALAAGVRQLQSPRQRAPLRAAGACSPGEALRAGGPGSARRRSGRWAVAERAVLAQTRRQTVYSLLWARGWAVEDSGKEAGAGPLSHQSRRGDASSCPLTLPGAGVECAFGCSLYLGADAWPDSKVSLKRKKPFLLGDGE